MYCATHGHGDHIGDAAPVAKKHGSTVVAIYELADYIGKQGVSETMGMNLGGTVELKDVAVTMVDAKHSAGAADDKGTHYTGVATGFVLAVAGGPVLYHAGDTCVFGDMQLIRELYQPKIVMLPIGGYYTMGPQASRARLPVSGAGDGSAHPFWNVSAAEGDTGGACGSCCAWSEGCGLEAGG